jgi:Tfp pilus assembly PilM family ATPase
MMLRKLIKPKKKKTLFVCSITENFIKVIKCQIHSVPVPPLLARAGSVRGSGVHNSLCEFVGLEIETLPSVGIDDKKITEKLNQIFRRLQYNKDKVILSLASNHATCRYLKVPTQIPEEIEKIVSLQASRYLPYPANELITGYQCVYVDSVGNTHLNLVIVHKNIIERYIKIFADLKITAPKIILSSFGLCNLYNSLIKLETPSTILLMDIDSAQVELAIISSGKLLFSRYFKINRTQPNWENVFIEEISKTRDAYLKEVAQEATSKIVLISAKNLAQEFLEILKKQTDLVVEILRYSEKINLPKALLPRVLSSADSFASLFGLGLYEVPESLNLLPQEIKEKSQKNLKRRENLRKTCVILGIFLILGLGIANDLDNKEKYLDKLKTELNKITSEAKPLEQIERGLSLLETNFRKKPAALDILYELHQVIPPEISLVNFSYEEDRQVILRGQTPQLNAVFTLVQALEKSAVFKNFNIKINYATKKKIQATEIIDFEVISTKR